MLVSDAGCAAQPSIIWERLSDVDGTTAFVTAAFRPAAARITNSAPVSANPQACVGDTKTSFSKLLLSSAFL
jgi:hypothetical protein